MLDDPGEVIFRAMIEEADGLPRLAPSASTLGIRRNKDIVPDQAGVVHRPAFRPREKNGLSCSRTIQSLPDFALPIEWGGRNARTVVWQIAIADLGLELAAGYDATPGLNEHVSVGPALSMPYDDYVWAIEATRASWIKVTKN